MSGHSKWSQIKRQKGVADNKRSAVFTKLANAITVAAREGGKDPAMNVRLRLAVDKAREANMPKDNIERAIKRGVGELDDKPLESVVYEGFGPDGVAIVAEAVTDNRNRTSAELRKIFGNHGGNLGGSNSVLWLFERRGWLEVNPGEHRDAIELAAIDAGALDIEEDGGLMFISTAPQNLDPVRQAVTASGGSVTSAEIGLTASASVAPTSESTREQIEKLLLELEDLPDVTHVSTNAAL
ncbi:MAG: YebC/PmpR family DNA-binding transcriptional regulator [Candidatus Kerfeldbacteria bacterium]|nr:YebC/PmpR family DNA-binding transcriptional regulator [Candidatus Kerfeldbacteria bacterium]